MSYFHVETDIIFAAQYLSKSAIIVYLALSNRCYGSYGERNMAWPSVKQLVEDTGFTERTVRAALAELQKRHGIEGPWIGKAGTMGNGVVKWVLIRRPQEIVRKGDKRPGMKKSTGGENSNRGGMQKPTQEGAETNREGGEDSSTRNNEKLEPEEEEELEVKNAGGGTDDLPPELEEQRAELRKQMDEGKISAVEYMALWRKAQAEYHRRNSQPPGDP